VHFIGMLAFNMNMPVTHDYVMTLILGLAVFLGSAFALKIVAMNRVAIRNLLFVGFVDRRAKTALSRCVDRIETIIGFVIL
jgi:NO-binding membrane sensor protein with MHYT domain